MATPAVAGAGSGGAGEGGAGSDSPGDVGHDPFASADADKSILDQMEDAGAFEGREPGDTREPKPKKKVAPIPPGQKPGQAQAKSDAPPNDQAPPPDDPSMGQLESVLDSMERAQSALTAGAIDPAKPFKIGKTEFKNLKHAEEVLKSLNGQRKSNLKLQQTVNEITTKLENAITTVRQWNQWHYGGRQGAAPARLPQEQGQTQGQTQTQRTEVSADSPSGAAEFLKSVGAAGFEQIQQDFEVSPKKAFARMMYMMGEHIEKKTADLKAQYEADLKKAMTEKVDPLHQRHQRAAEANTAVKFWREQVVATNKSGALLYPELVEAIKAKDDKMIARYVEGMQPFLSQLPKDVRNTPRGFRTAYLLFQESLEEGEGESDDDDLSELDTDSDDVDSDQDDEDEDPARRRSRSTGNSADVLLKNARRADRASSSHAAPRTGGRSMGPARD